MSGIFSANEDTHRDQLLAGHPVCESILGPARTAAVPSVARGYAGLCRPESGPGVARSRVRRWLVDEGHLGTHARYGRSRVGLDCAAANERAYEYLQRDLTPTPGERIRFVCADFSSGLGLFADASFDRVISGLSISYAESIDPVTGDWSTQAYDAVLSEVHRLLRSSGMFVFSVNVPNPKWTRVGLRSLRGVFGAKRPLRYLQKSWRMYRYGAWLTREARTGRFHYLPAEDVTARLTEAGFTQISHRLSYCDQAYIFTCTRS